MQNNLYLDLLRDAITHQLTKQYDAEQLSSGRKQVQVNNSSIIIVMIWQRFEVEEKKIEDEVNGKMYIIIMKTLH